jgi:rhamnulokinase
MATTSCVAIDLGASQGRVVAVDCDGERLALREIRRFETPRHQDPETGYLCWDIAAIERSVVDGIAAAGSAGPVHSAGVDGWGVDYVLLDRDHRLVAPAVSYRDPRTQGMMDAVFARIPAAEIYRRTAIQLQPFNTLYQLAATARQRPTWLARTRHLLMLPDYLHFRLCGVIGNEYTNATTTQLCGVDGSWDDELLGAAGIVRQIVAAPRMPGVVLGETRDRIAIALPGTHDTASAVAGIPLGPGDAFLSSGTWSLMGIESARPFGDAAARACNLSNEGGAAGGYRVLKNIAGLWLVQRIAEELAISDPAALMAAAAAAPAWRSLVEPDDRRFLSPPSMIAAIRGFCAETGQPVPDDAGALARCALDSVALCYRRVLREIELVTGAPIARIQLGGGGGHNQLLNQLAADACQVPVLVGPAEISVLGNAAVQLIALGVVGSLAEARALIRRSFPVREVLPRRAVPDEVWARFGSLGCPTLDPPHRASPAQAASGAAAFAEEHSPS